MSENVDGHKESATDIVSLPLSYRGELPVGHENNYGINNNREKVDITHKLDKISISTRYGGRLPVGRERS